MRREFASFDTGCFEACFWCFYDILDKKQGFQEKVDKIAVQKSPGWRDLKAQLLSYALYNTGYFFRSRQKVITGKNKMANSRSEAQQQKDIEDFINNLSDFEVDDQDDTYSTDKGWFLSGYLTLFLIFL